MSAPVFLLCVDAKGTKRLLRKGRTYTFSHEYSCACGAGPFTVVLEVPLRTGRWGCWLCREVLPGTRHGWHPRRFIRINDPSSVPVSAAIERPREVIA